MNKHIKNILLTSLILLLLGACGPSSVPADASTSDPIYKYIGSTHPPFPEGLSEIFSMMIENTDDYGFSLVMEGSNKMLWLKKITRYDANGIAYWEVKDVLDLTSVESGLMLIPDGCSLNGVPDSEIIVTAKDGTARSAWRANTTLDKFESIPTTGIECRSDKVMDL